MSRKLNARRSGFIAVITGMTLLAAACGGGGSNKSTAAKVANADDQTTTTVAAPVTSAPEETGATSTTAVSSGSAAVTPTTTARKSTATIAKRTTAVVAGGSQGVTQAPKGGLTNVTAAPSTAPRDDIQPGGTITYLKAGEVTGIDPIRMGNAGSNDGPAGLAIYDVLVYSEGGLVKPQVAESLTSSDGLVWTMKIHPNIKFTDGTPYDAAAVKFNLERLQDPKYSATRAPQANLIGSIATPDAVTVRMTLKSKNAVFPQALVLIPFIGSPTAIQADANKFANSPVGAGPFVLKSWVRDSEMVLERNPNYWNAPRPYIDRLVIKPIVDESQRLNTLCTGDATMAYIGTVGSAQELESRKCGTNRPMVLNGGLGFNFNMTKPPMNDPRVRQAVAMAIDPDDYSKVLTAGLIPPIRAAFRSDSPFADPNIRQLAFNATQAQQLFDAAAADAGGPITINIQTLPSPGYLNPAMYVQGVLNKFRNVKATVASVAVAQHVASCNSRAYTGICVLGALFDDPEPAWTGGFVCNAATSPTGYCNAKFDAAVTANQVDLDANQRINDMKEAQKVFYADVPTVYVEQSYRWTFTATNVQDFVYANDGLIMTDRIWLKTR